MWIARVPPLSLNRHATANPSARAGLAEHQRRFAAVFLREQGAEVYVTSTLRPRQRGYLMWVAFVLSRTTSDRELRSELNKIAGRNREWYLGVPILWEHPDGLSATRAAAREMADAYEVVYATEDGARDSNHYSGVAVDMVAVGLPRRLRLKSPDGRAQALFDLSAADQTRDLSLSPELIEWIEAQFGLHKLRSDYPHWEDTEH